MSEPKPESHQTSPEQPKLPVDETWLTEMLNSKCAADGVLDDYSCQAICEGKGFLSVITRVHLNWNKEKSQRLELLPKDIIIKKPTIEKIHAVDESMKEVFPVETLLDLHNRECRAYAFFNKHSPAPFPMARYFYSEEMTTKGGSGILIVEDITDSAISLSFIDDASIEQVYELAKHVASLQAYGMNNPDVADYIVPMETDPFENMFKEMGITLDEIRAEYPGVLKWSNDEFEAIIKKRHEKCPMVSKPAFPSSQVVALGDVQPNNILWHRTGPNLDRPSNKVAAFIDFQICHLGNCMVDIANTMTMSLPADVRREKTDSVIDLYLTELNAQTQGKSPVTAAECKRLQLEMMFQYAAMGLCMFTKFMKMVKIEEERKDTMLYRFLACVEEALAGLEALGIE